VSGPRPAGGVGLVAVSSRGHRGLEVAARLLGRSMAAGTTALLGAGRAAAQPLAAGRGEVEDYRCAS
jgi:hypothetical protein